MYWKNRAGPWNWEYQPKKLRVKLTQEKRDIHETLEKCNEKQTLVHTHEYLTNITFGRVYSTLASLATNISMTIHEIINSDDEDREYFANW